MEYGTGAIMAVPGHDERDFEFAREYDLPIVRVVAGAGQSADTPLDEAFVETDGCVLVNSAHFDGLRVEEARTAIVTELAAHHAARPVVNYRLHDWCISRQRYWGPPIPIVYCDTCGVVPVPEAQLPVVLPDIEDFRPDDSGVSPLARHEEWYHTPCPQCGARARRETDVSDTFLDSAWYFLRYPSSERDDVPFDAELTKRWLPVTSYIGGNEHAVLHLLYSRFVTMVLKDAGLIDFEEPFARFRAHGMIVREGREDVEESGQRGEPRPVHRRVGRGRLPHLPDVPRPVRGRGRFPRQGNLRREALPRPAVEVGARRATRRCRRSRRSRASCTRRSRRSARTFRG